MKPITIKSRGYKFLYSLFWLMIWQGVYLYVGKAILVPSPFQTLKALVKLLQEPSFYINIGVTFGRVLWATGISLVIGLLLSLGAYLYVPLKAFFKPIIIVMKSTPVMAIIILALLWFKSDHVPIFVGFLMCLPIVYTNSLQSLEALDQNLLELVKVYRVSFIYCIRDFFWPYMRPSIVSTLCLIVGMAWKVVIAAEVLAVPKYAMGYELLDAKVYLETEKVFAWVIVIVTLSELCERVIQSGFKRRYKHYDSNQ